MTILSLIIFVFSLVFLIRRLDRLRFLKTFSSPPALLLLMHSCRAPSILATIEKNSRWVWMERWTKATKTKARWRRKIRRCLWALDGYMGEGKTMEDDEAEEGETTVEKADDIFSIEKYFITEH